MIRGRIFGIKRMEIHDGDGLRTTVFFKGCPLSCLWCHNPEGIGFHKDLAFFRNKCLSCGTCTAVCSSNAVSQGKINRELCKQCFTCADRCPTEAIVGFGRDLSPEELFDELRSDFPYFENGRGGVTFSGGECLAQPDFAVQTAKLLFDAGISVDIDTCGFVPFSALERILPYTDTFLYDVKAIDSDLHKKLTGQPNERILENLRALSDLGASIEIRYPFVVGYNDTECGKIGAFLSELSGIRKIKVLPYHPFAASRYEALEKENRLPSADAVPNYNALEQAVATLRGYGLNAVNGAADD